MAKRISSMFSIGSNSSDQTQNSSSSRLSSSVHPARPSKEQTPADLNVKHPPQLQPTSDPPLDVNGPNEAFLLPHSDSDHPVLQSPHLLSPIPIDETSPNGSRRASISGRPHSRLGDGEFPHQSPLLKALPNRSESPAGFRPLSGGSAPGSNAGSRPSSRPPSRPASPVKSRPQTPTNESKLRKRRSWVPGRSKVDIPECKQESYPSQAWVVSPQEKHPYDVTSLANFLKVCWLPPALPESLVLTPTKGPRTMG